MDNKVGNNQKFGMLDGAYDWTVLVDLGKQLKFPTEIENTRSRSHLVTLKWVVLWELMCPSEERIEGDHQLK